MTNGKPLAPSPADPVERPRELQQLLRVLDAANRTIDASGLAEIGIQTILATVPVELVIFLLIDPHSNRLRLFIPVDAPIGLAHSLERLADSTGLSFESDVPVLDSGALSKLAEELRSILKDQGYPELVTTPLTTGGPVLGVLIVAESARTATDLELVRREHKDFLEAIGTAVCSVLERELLAERLRASEETYRSFVEESPDGFWESDTEGLVTLVNQAGLNMVGYSREEVVGKVFPSIAVGDSQSARERAERLLQNGYYVDERIKFRAKDGSLKTATLSVRAVRDDHGKIVKYQTVVRDATARAGMERELERRISELQVIAHVGELIAQSTDPEAPLREIGREICKVLGADSVSVQLLKGDSLRVVMSSVDQSSLMPIYDYHRKIMEGGEPRIVQDREATRVDEGQRALLTQLGFSSSVGVRLFEQGVTLGILFVNQRTPREWTPDEIRLIGTFARQIGGAMHTTNLLRETQSRVRELESVAGMSMFAASLTDEDRLIDRALQFISESLGVDLVGVHLLEEKEFRIGRIWGGYPVPTEPFRMTPLLDEVVSARKPFVFDHDHPLPSDPDAERLINEAAAKAVIMVPMAAASGVIGLLSVARRTERLWTRADVRSVQTFANLLATGIANARLLSSLEQERGELEATLNSVFSGVFTTDERGTIQSWNRAAAEMTGYSEHVMLGENWSEVARLVNDKPDKLIFEAMAEGEVVFGLAPRSVKAADGRVIPLGEAAAPLKDQSGKIRGAVGAFWDKTRENAAERVRLDFLHEVSHELRNSLTVVLAMATMLRDKKVQGTTRERAIHVLSEQVDRLRAFSERFLQFEREQIRQPLQETRLDVRKELSRLVDAARLAHPEHTFKVTGNPGMVFADRARLETAVSNLLDNSAKFSPRGIPILIEAKAIAGGLIGVAIRNEGPGIPAKEKKRIFERGYRAPGSRVDGTGIGLWLVETKLHEMGGEICIDSNGSRGVTFSFTLRQARGENGQEQSAHSDSGRRQSRSRGTQRRARARRV